MTAFALPENPSPHYAALASDSFWKRVIAVQDGSRRYALPLHNFAGRNIPALHGGLMVEALGILPHERVLDVGGGDAPFERADVVTDAFLDTNTHRSGRPVNPQGKTFVQCFAEELPFADGEFDAVLCRQVLEHAVDPAQACREIMRVARRGFIETPSPLAEYVGGHPTHRWIVALEQLPGETEPTLVFRRKPFRRAPFRYAMRPLWYADADFRFRWEWEFRNLANTQLLWEGSFKFRVEDDGDSLDYDDPAQAAEVHLDCALCSMRWGRVPLEAIAPDVEIAVGLRPDWAVAQNALGIIRWHQNRYPEARTAFEAALHLEPANTDYAFNARLKPFSGTPRLAFLPPDREDREDIETNFAGKVFYAFVNYDDRLARDLGITATDRVLDVGGGQRPLKRADVSIDFDVFEGIHRQGLAISREKPLVCGDVQTLPFKDGAFDVACCRMVLEHVLDPASAVRELQRVAKRGFIETPNTLWEILYGHPTHRWLIEFEAATRTLVFQRKPFDRMPFRSAMVPYLYTQRDVQRAFEVTFRNIAATQVMWDENNPLHVRVEDEDDSYDYLKRPEDAARGSLNYARDLHDWGLPGVAKAETEDALRIAGENNLPHLHGEALQLRLQIAQALGENSQAVAAQFPSPGSPQGVRQQGISVQQQPAILTWNAPLLDPSGYADEARHFLFALAGAGVDVAARPIRWSDKTVPLSPERERLLSDMMTRPSAPNGVSVAHILASAFRRDPNARVCVGRTMFETDRLPEGWAAACNVMDVVWVPSAFNVETFAFAGVKREKLRVVPGAIDLTPYNPNAAPLPVDGRRGFNFLSLFDWTLRKGWDVLVRAYVEEFQPDEDVALILKTHSSVGYSTGQIVDQVTQLLAQLGRDPNRIPDIVFEMNTVPDTLLPNLYRAADCYVMPSRGEGWGRPFMEAMAMGLPVIATNWSGQTAFLTEDTAHLLNFEVANVSEAGWRETPTFRGHRWAEPSVSHLRQLLRRAFEEREAGRELGQRARAHIEQNFTYAPVARILQTELARIQG